MDSATGLGIGLRAVDVRFSREAGFQLNCAEFCARRGQVTGVSGQSGAGKSTLCALFAGFEIPTRGNIEVDGESVVRPGLIRERLWRLRRRVHLVEQQGILLPHLRIAQNFALAESIAFEESRKAALTREEVICALSLRHLENAYPGDLSGGELRRALLARGILAAPAVLLLDEPTSGTDTVLLDAFERLLLLLLERTPNLTIVAVSHDIALLLRICTSIYAMESGQMSAHVLHPRRDRLDALSKDSPFYALLSAAIQQSGSLQQ